MRIGIFLNKLFHARAYGFTLIEILVVIGMIGILASTVLVAVNPLRQFAQARNTQRISNVQAILNAVGNRIAENQGLFAGQDCPSPIPSSTTMMGSSGYNIRPCLVPQYISELPFDPTTGNNSCTDLACTTASYNTGYTIALDTSMNRITVCAPSSKDDGAQKPYCLTR